jgi:hypothetical protein
VIDPVFFYVDCIVAVLNGQYKSARSKNLVYLKIHYLAVEICGCLSQERDIVLFQSIVETRYPPRNLDELVQEKPIRNKIMMYSYWCTVVSFIKSRVGERHNRRRTEQMQRAWGLILG